MTTKVVIACPDNSVHNAIVTVQNKQPDGSWLDAPPVMVKPRETAAPIYLTSSCRVLITEEERATVGPSDKK
jgi:hypothetical protein